MERRYTYKNLIRDENLKVWRIKHAWEAEKMAYEIASRLFNSKNMRLKTPMTDRQKYALARSECDPIIQRVDNILTHCSIASLTKNSVNIINYYTSCFDWIDPVVASILLEHASKDSYEDKNNDKIFFDRHYLNNKYSTGDDELPFASVHFGKDSTLDEVISYLKNHWDLIHDPNLKVPKQVQSNIEKIRETIIRAIYYNHKELSAYDTRKIIAYVSRSEEALSNLADNLTDKEIYTIRQRLRQDLEKDWFAHAFPDYENDLRSNRLLYKDWKDSYYRNKYRDFFGCPDAKVKRLVRFELTFDHNSRKFALTKV